MSIPALLLRDEPAERRGDERWRVRLGALRADSHDSSPDLTILNVSATGLLLQTEHALPLGVCLIVELPNSVPKFCKVVWSSGRLHGTAFSEPLDPSELQELVVLSLTKSALAGAGYTGRSQVGALLAVDDDVLSPDDAAEALSLVTKARIILGASSLLWVLIGFSLFGLLAE